MHEALQAASGKWRQSSTQLAAAAPLAVVLPSGPKGLQQYIDTIRQGKGQNPKQYSARYICSLVGDFHRTLLYGGEWCQAEWNP